MTRLLILSLGLFLLSGCSEPVETEFVMTPLMAEAQEAGHKKFGDTMVFKSIFESKQASKQAVCGLVEKESGEPQQFIYVRKHFLLQELSPSGEWDSQWFTECV